MFTVSFIFRGVIVTILSMTGDFPIKTGPSNCSSCSPNLVQIAVKVCCSSFYHNSIYK